MNHTELENAVQRDVALAVLTHLQQGEFNEATAYFAETFQFNDWGIGLEFRNIRRLADFFKKIRELYPDSSLQRKQILVSGDHVIIQWTLQTVLTEPFFGGLSRKVPISLHGASIVCIENACVKSWSDYYDGLKSRRTALAAYFDEWIEL
jgi:SnoaL-like polyketide cyclase